MHIAVWNAAMKPIMLPVYIAIAILQWIWIKGMLYLISNSANLHFVYMHKAAAISKTCKFIFSQSSKFNSSHSNRPVC